jgi:hypothetical protein
VTLDFIAASAVARARLLERAVHDRGPWQIEAGDLTVDAVKVRTPHRVIFLGYFERPPAEPTEQLYLHCRGNPVSSMPVSVPTAGNFCVEWVLAGPQVETAHA